MFTGRQLTFGIATFIGGSSLFTVFITQISFQDSWFSLFCALLLSLAVISVYVLLIRKFPQKGLLEMHLAVYGKLLGRMINLAYTLFCILFAALSFRNLGDFFTGYIMTEMPMAFALSLFAVTAVLACLSGITAILRNSFLFFVFMASALLTNTLLLIPNMELYNFLPMLRLGWEAYTKSAFVLSAAPFCEIIVFLILLPYADKNADSGKSFFIGLALGGLHFLITVFRDIATLGTALTYLEEPAYEAVRLINVMDIFSRLEILFAFTLTVMRVFKLCVLLCAILRAIEDTLGRSVKHPSIWLSVSAAGAVFLAMRLFKSGMELPEWFRTSGAWVFAVFEMALPLLTLLLASLFPRVRKKT